MTSPSYHIALVTSAGKGHMLPMVSLAEILTECSELVKVSLLYPSGPGLDAPPASQNPRLQVLGFPLPLSEGGAGLMQAVKIMAEQEGAVCRSCESVSLSSSWGPPTYYLFDMFTTWVMDMASRLGRPSALLLTSPIYFLYTLITDCKAGYIDVPNLGRLRQVDLTDMSGGLSHIMIEQFKKLRRCSVVVANDSEILYKEDGASSSMLQQMLEASIGHCSSRIYLTGFWAVKDVRLHQKADEDAVLNWLDQQRDGSVIFIALGSWCPIPTVDLVELARGLQGTEQPFLWAYRGLSQMPATIPHAPNGYIVPPAKEPTEADGLPIGFREQVKGRALITAWVNQPAVLRHPAVRAFVTHCGWNSLTEAFALCGKPIIGIPLMAEQNMNGIMVEKLGIGKRLWHPEHPRHIDRREVRDTILTQLGNPEVALKASQMNCLINEAWKPQGSAAHHMQTFLQREVFRHN